MLLLENLSQNALLMYLSLGLACLEHQQVVSFEDTFKTSSKSAHSVLQLLSGLIA